MSRHAAGSVMLGQSVGCQDVREARILGRCIGIVGPFLAIRRRIALLRIERIRENGFERLIVGGQWSILQAARDVRPTDAVRMQSERSCSAESFGAVAVPEVGCGVGCISFS